jgi:Fe-S cluster biogenesis protein NfuA/rhodanese-related sulfurtransferase
MKFTNKNIFDRVKHEIDGKRCLVERKKNMPPIILDIRSAEEYAKRHLIGAYSLPVESLKSNLNQIPPYAQIILYGSDDDERTSESVKLLVDNKFTDVSFVKGGVDSIFDALSASQDEVILADHPEDKWDGMIEKVLNEKVRPTLASDGGGLEVVKIDRNKVYINYQGACSGCASAATGTLNFIKAALSTSLNHDIDVIMA